MNSNQTIYEKYGGYDFFHRCIYGLYLSMFDHPEISYHFVGVDIEKLSKHQTQFLVRAIGGPDLYEGGPIHEVHKDMDISLYQFSEIATAFRNVFLENGVDKKDVDFIMNFVGSHQKAVVTKNITWIDQFMIPIYRIFKKLRRSFKI